MPDDDRFNAYRLIVPCPCCHRNLRIRGHDRNNWHVDSDGRRVLQKFYVSCPCGQNLLEQTHTLKAVEHANGKPGSMALTIETQAIPINKVNLENAL